MGFNMCIIKTKKKVIDKICADYQKDVNNLPYEVFMELEDESHSKLFTSCINILSGIIEKLPHENGAYVCLNEEHYDLILYHCNERVLFLQQYVDDIFSDKRFEYMETEKLFYYLLKLKPDWDADILLYGHDC